MHDVFEAAVTDSELRRKQTFEWFSWWKYWETLVVTFPVEDSECSGHPSTGHTEENMEKVYKIAH
jgi:hypothetical protein